MKRLLSVLNARPVHPGRGEPSRIQLSIILNLKNNPIESITLTQDQALLLAEELLISARLTRG